ncbi:hypothetical protein VNO77_02059 [Canavalia gladiata]|uniref:Uncharacterized protein n=1 Tax=Canavalia gladiata TaxID=3824 RepID=A0AAN9MXG0_CANGL
MYFLFSVIVVKGLPPLHCFMYEAYDKDMDLKVACLVKDAIKRYSTNFLTTKSTADCQNLLGLTVLVL